MYDLGGGESSMKPLFPMAFPFPIYAHSILEPAKSV